MIFPLIELIINGDLSENIFGLGFKKIFNFEENVSFIKYLILIIIFFVFF